MKEPDITQTIQLLGEHLHHIGLANDFLGLTTKAQETKEKINWTVSKLNPCLSKISINTVKKQPTE